MKCTSCGIDNAENAQFCGKCGVDLSVSPIAGSTPQVKVGFSEAAKLGFQRYVDFSGRSSRAEFWWWLLFTALVSVGFTVLSTFAIEISFISILWQLAVLIPSIAIWVRRLHDINRSGWWYLLHIFGFGIGSIVLIIWACMPSKADPNK